MQHMTFISIAQLLWHLELPAKGQIRALTIVQPVNLLPILYVTITFSLEALENCKQMEF